MSKRAIEVDLTGDDAAVEKKGAMSCCVCLELKPITHKCQPGSELHGMCDACLGKYNEQGGNFKCPLCNVDMRKISPESPLFKEVMSEHTPFERLTTLWSARREALSQAMFSSSPINLPENTAFLQWMIEHEFKTDSQRFLARLFDSDDTLSALMFRKDSEREFNRWLLNDSCISAIFKFQEVQVDGISRLAIESLFPWALDLVPSKNSLSAYFVGGVLMNCSRATYEWAALVWHNMVRNGDMIEYSSGMHARLDNEKIPSEVLCFIGTKLADKAEMWKRAVARNGDIDTDALVAMVHSWRPFGAALERPLRGSERCVEEFSSNLLIQHDGRRFTGPVGRCFTERVEVKEIGRLFSGNIHPYLTIATDPQADSKSPVIITYPSHCYEHKVLSVILHPDKQIHLLASTLAMDIRTTVDLLYRSLARPEDDSEAVPYIPIIEIVLGAAAVYRFSGFDHVQIADMRNEPLCNWPVFKRSF